MSDASSTAEEPMVCTTRRWSKPDSNSRSHPLTRSRSLGGAGASGSARQDRRRHREARNSVCSRPNLAANFRECLARLHMDKTGFECEIGFGGFEHLAAPSSPSRQRRGLASAPAAKPLLSRRGQRRGGGSPGLGVGISRYNSSVLKLLQCEQAASDPAWPIVFDPRSGSLHARKPIKLLLRAVRPCHQDETAAGLRRKNLEGGLMFDCCHFHDFSNHPTNRGLSACPYPNRRPNIFSASRNVV